MKLPKGSCFFLIGYHSILNHANIFCLSNVFIIFFSEGDVVKVSFYRMVQIGSAGDAASLVAAVRDALIEDNIWMPLKTNLVSVVTGRCKNLTYM